jgi:hypothetical protein
MERSSSAAEAVSTHPVYLHDLADACADPPAPPAPVDAEGSPADNVFELHGDRGVAQAAAKAAGRSVVEAVHDVVDSFVASASAAVARRPRVRGHSRGRRVVAVLALLAAIVTVAAAVVPHHAGRGRPAATTARPKQRPVVAVPRRSARLADPQRSVVPVRRHRPPARKHHRRVTHPRPRARPALPRPAKPLPLVVLRPAPAPRHSGGDEFGFER